MKKTLLSMAAALPVAALAGLYGDTPDAKHAWSVHDRNRPNPVCVTPAAQSGGAPSDAIVLFDGSKESFEKNWCDANGKPSQWKLGSEGEFYCAAGWKNGGNIFTRGKFGDCQLHLEFRHDADIAYDGNAQMVGNSGVFLMSNYEIQVLESARTDPKDMKIPNYADGQAGAVYAENPPAVNPARKAGEWQVYDIVFHQPVWKDGKMLHPGSITLFFNGVLVQDHWEMEGLTTHCVRRPLAPHETKLPLFLQDHGCVVRFRNIWLRELPSRWDNLTHSAMAADTDEVMKLRGQTAAKLFAKIKDPSACDGATVCALAEVVSYANEGKYADAFGAAAKGFQMKIGTSKDSELKAMKQEIMDVRNALWVLVRNKVLPDKFPLRQEIERICKALDKKW